MRIISGEFRSRKLLSPPDAETTRPIPDRVKESVFSLLRGHMEDASVFDGFAGSGAFGLEAISRGAARCVFVEKDKSAANLLRRNIETLGVQDRCDLVVGDVLGPGALARCPRPATIIFLDPPYPLVRDVVGWKRTSVQLERLIQCLAPDGYAIIRTPWPFFQLAPVQLADPGKEDAAAEHPRKGRKGRKRHSRRDRQDADGDLEVWSIDDHRPLSELTEEEIDALDARESEEARLAAEKAKVERVWPDLSIPGAIGPETHEYGTMAVHLYQRAPA